MIYIKIYFKYDIYWVLNDNFIKLMNTIKTKISELGDFLKENYFKIGIIVILLIIFLFKLDLHNNIDSNIKNMYSENGIQVFVQEGCPHCRDLENFLLENEQQFNKYDIKFFNIGTKQNRDLLLNNVLIHKIQFNQVGTPMIFAKNDYMIGFTNTGDGKKNFIDFVENSAKNITSEKKQAEYLQRTLTIPFYGEVDLFNVSLPIATILIGLADGFNPCAMWVLVYLLSITITLHDKRKIWLLVGNFVLTSGVLYFLFMTAWLNLFLFIGYIRILNLIIGLFAVYFGIMTLKEYIDNHGQVVCKLSDNKTRKESMNKIQKIVKSELSLFSILAIMFLAFVVNSIEFVCSAALPATYTYLITRANLSTLQYYLYILLYTIMFMADDIIVFSCAAFTLNNYTGEKYEKYSAIVGGVLMFLIGIMIVFFPNLLR